MTSPYSFLKDDLALLEIRKHQWIESEKQGQEIGFATAAVDWVKRYGPAWKTNRLKTSENPVVFSEKRSHRRFSRQFPIQLSLNHNLLKSQTDDISLIGLSCTLPESLPADAQAEVTILLKDKDKPRSRFRFTSRISRVSQPQDKKGYHVFLPFNEEVRDYLRANAEILNN